MNSIFRDLGIGGKGEIRTHGSIATTYAFQAYALNHSATFPGLERSKITFSDQIKQAKARRRVATRNRAWHHSNSSPLRLSSESAAQNSDKYPMWYLVWLSQFGPLSKPAEPPKWGHKVLVQMAPRNNPSLPHASEYRCVLTLKNEKIPASEQCDRYDGPWPVSPRVMNEVYVDIPGPGAEVIKRPNEGQTNPKYDQQNGSTHVPQGSTYSNSYTGPRDFNALKTLALQKRVPEVIYDRAVANYRELLAQGKTGRPCFMGADMTSSPGRTWVFCFSPKPWVLEVPSSFGGGVSLTTQQCTDGISNTHMCPQFFGNRPGSCLSPGGAFITGTSSAQVANGRVFTPLNGLEPGVNSNTSDRKLGIHKLQDHSGNSLEGKSDPRYVSQGSTVWPATFNGMPMSELSDRASGKGMAYYAYPSKQDLELMMSHQPAPYWDPTCLKDIGGMTAWFDVKDSAAQVAAKLVPSQTQQLENALGTVEERPAAK